MYSINGTNIKLTRGDTFIAKVGMMRGKEPYELQDGDSVRFAVKHKTFLADLSDYKDTDPIFTIDIGSDLLLNIQPEQTKPLGFGTYAYDIQITFENGDIDTFINGDFILTPEVD